MRLHFAVVTAIVVVSVGGIQNASQDAAADKTVRSLRIDLPLTSVSICTAALQWGAAARETVGIECVWEPVDAPRSPNERVVRQLDLSRLPATAALEQMMRHLPAYDAETRNGVAVFRPKRTRGSTPSILDVTVPRFTLENVNLVEAAVAVNRLFDPNYRVSGPEIAGPRSNSRIQATSEEARALIEESVRKYNERFVKRINVDLSGATVEEILNTIARQAHSSWRVMYVAATGRYEDALIEFLGNAEPLRTGPGRAPRKTSAR